MGRSPHNDRILLAHGSGGRLTRDLIAEEILARFKNETLAALPDAASLTSASPHLLFSTDSYVVQPLFFAGGNIGSLAVHGTVNDLAVAGALPRWLSLSMILEENLPLETLRAVLDTVKEAAGECGVQIVTGDTKVVRRGQCDGMYLNTAGIGERLPGLALAAGRIEPGDEILVSGPLGDHGMAIMAAREDVKISNGPVSDTGPVHRLVAAIERCGQAVKFMRDPTRGGVAAVLNEIVAGQTFGAELEEEALPFESGTRALAEMFGVDLLQIASEGRMLLVCAAGAGGQILESWRKLPEGRKSTKIGTVTRAAGRVTLSTFSGGRRLIDVPEGEILPRIC